ncbi:hypothetical protein GCM10022631_07500 [Deinococcus rubellus]|uniref:hypothetical protein n=1 Tax=Deinococcus rubellus TaxID=1889240 RepID=UPI0031E90EEC
MYAEPTLVVALAAPIPLNPAKKLALATWADDGGAVLPESGGEVVLHRAIAGMVQGSRVQSVEQPYSLVKATRARQPTVTDLN